MQKFRIIYHAIVIHQSYLNRPSRISKPSFCYSLEACIKYPFLFEDPNLCQSCTCKYVCRYKGNGPLLGPSLTSIQADIGADILPAEIYPTNSKSSIL